jgi:hypothetical protein
MKIEEDLNYGLNGGNLGYTSKSYKKSISNYDKYYTANKKSLEWKCNECSSTKYPTWQQKSTAPDICDECMKLGWSEATPEDFYNDPDLKDHVAIQSPITFIKLD